MGNLDNFPEFRDMQERWYQEQMWEHEQEMKEETDEEMEAEDKKNSVSYNYKFSRCSPGFTLTRDRLYGANI